MLRLSVRRFLPALHQWTMVDYLSLTSASRRLYSKDSALGWMKVRMHFT